VQRPQANEGGREEEENRSGISAGKTGRLHDRKTFDMTCTEWSDAQAMSSSDPDLERKFRRYAGREPDCDPSELNSVVFIKTE
jgi:hypothetical protein